MLFCAGMLPIRTRRGREAMMRLTCYEGIPAKYSHTRPKVCSVTVIIWIQIYAPDCAFFMLIPVKDFD